MLRHLMHGPVGDPETCAFCGEQIVRMPGGHYRLATGDLARERVKCAKSPERDLTKRRHLPEQQMQPIRTSAPPEGPTLTTGDLP